MSATIPTPARALALGVILPLALIGGAAAQQQGATSASSWVDPPARTAASAPAASRAARSWISPWFSPDHGGGGGGDPARPGVIPISVDVDRLPAWIGIDPYNKRIDRNSDDNLTPVDAPK